MLHLRDGLRVASFLRFSAAAKSTNAQFYSNFWPLLSSTNRREPKQTLASFHGVGMKQYFCSNASTDDVTMETADVAAAEADETGTTTAPAVDEPQQQQTQRGNDGSIKLAKKFLRSKSKAAGDAPIGLFLELNQGRSGSKFFKISKSTPGVAINFFHFPAIRVPEDAYSFVRAMDELLGELATKEGQKLPSTGYHVLFNTSSPGFICNFTMELKWVNGGYFNVDLGSQRTEAKPDHVERKMFLQLRQFYWLRHQMGELLAEFDGSEPVDVPPKFPGDWLLIDGRPRSALARSRGSARPRSQAVQRAPYRQQQPNYNYNANAMAEQQQPNADANLAMAQQLQVQLLSQQIQQLQQQMSTMAMAPQQPVMPSIVPMPMPMMPQFMGGQFVQPGQFVQQPIGQGQPANASANGDQEWPKMAMLMAQTLRQLQARQVPAGNGQPMPQENAMKPAPRKVPMPRGNESWEQQQQYPGQYQQQQVYQSNMPLTQQQRQAKRERRRQAGTAGNFRQQQQRNPSMVNLDIQEEDFEAANMEQEEEGMAPNANANMAKPRTSSTRTEEIEEAIWGDLLGWTDGKEEGGSGQQGQGK